MEHFGTTIALVGIVIVVASLLSGVLERSRIPLVAVFLALGGALGPWGLGILDVPLDSPILRTLAILALTLVLFTDAVTIESSALRAHRALAWRIVGPGTLLPAGLVALAAWWLLDVSIPLSIILGAALASTDPVLLRSVQRSRTLPPVPRIALRLETGMNDVVLLPVISVTMLLMGNGPAGGEELTRSLLGLFVLGPVLGALVGWLGIVVLVSVRERIGVRRDYESLYALGLAFSAFAMAEAVGGSGFLAAFAAGLMVAIQDVELCDCFLEYGEATAEMMLLLTFVALGTSLIWTGLSAVDVPTLLVAAVALTARTLVLLPLLGGLGIDARDRRLIALLGPRGLSSLLLVLLPVFAGVPGADRLFTITCLVVLLSVLIHGVGIARFLGRSAGRPPSGPVTAERPAGAEPAPAGATPERVTVDELRALQAQGEPVIVADVRGERSYEVDPLRAVGSVRLPPDDPVRAAHELRLSQHATVVLYCA